MMQTSRHLVAAAGAVLLLSGTLSGCNLMGGGGNRQETANTSGKGGLGGLMGGRNQSAARQDGPPPAQPRPPSDSNRSGGVDAGGKPDSGPAPGATPAPPPAPAPAQRDGYDRRVRIVNASGQRLTHIYGSPTRESAWGADRIPTTPFVSEGAAIVVDFNDNNGECQYDLRAVFADSSSAEQRNVNICAISEWQAEPGGGSTR